MEPDSVPTTRRVASLTMTAMMGALLLAAGGAVAIESPPPVCDFGGVPVWVNGYGWVCPWVDSPDVPLGLADKEVEAAVNVTRDAIVEAHRHLEPAYAALPNLPRLPLPVGPLCAVSEGKVDAGYAAAGWKIHWEPGHPCEGA